MPSSRRCRPAEPWMAKRRRHRVSAAQDGRSERPGEAARATPTTPRQGTGKHPRGSLRPGNRPSPQRPIMSLMSGSGFVRFGRDSCSKPALRSPAPPPSGRAFGLRSKPRWAPRAPATHSPHHMAARMAGPASTDGQWRLGTDGKPLRWRLPTRLHLGIAFRLRRRAETTRRRSWRHGGPYRCRRGRRSPAARGRNHTADRPGPLPSLPPLLRTRPGGG